MNHIPIPPHGNPNANIFGSVGDMLGTDEGRIYYKTGSASQNIGWAQISTPTPTITPTPTLTPGAPAYFPFSCNEVQITGSTKCIGNVVEIMWNLPMAAEVSYSFSWNRRATIDDPVFLIGLDTPATLTAGELSYTSTYFAQAGTNTLGFFRTNNVQDTVRIGAKVTRGNNFNSVKAEAYRSGSNTTTVRAFAVTGSYRYHLRFNNSNDFFSNATYTNPFTQTISNTVSPQTLFIELVDSDVGIFTFPTFTVVDCSNFIPTPTPTITPSPTITQTTTPTITLTQTITPTYTPTPTITVSATPLAPGVTPTITATRTPTVTPTQTRTPTTTPTQTITPTNTPTITMTPTPTAVCEQVWFSYDYSGKANASWIECGGIINSTGNITGTPYATVNANGVCAIQNTFNVISGTNFRSANCGDSDPRSVSYQLDATFDAMGRYDIDYIDPYGILRNVSASGGVEGQVQYGVACVAANTSLSINTGNGTISGRYC